MGHECKNGEYCVARFAGFASERGGSEGKEEESESGVRRGGEGRATAGERGRDGGGAASCFSSVVGAAPVADVSPSTPRPHRGASLALPAPCVSIASTW